MLNRRNALQMVGLAGAALSIAPFASAKDKTALAWTAFPSSEAGFLRAPVLVTGATEAVLIDAGFTFADGQTVADAIRRSGKRLTTIYITTNDPDYYFGLAPIKAAFPQARILAAPGTVALMQKKAAGKIATWAPKLGDNGPKSVSDLIFPEPSTVTSLSVDGETLQILTAAGVGDRGRYIWIPSLGAVFGGVAVFGGMYPWVADVPTVEGRTAWRAALDNMLALKPRIVVPGHMTAQWPMDASGITFTRDYLAAFEIELAKAKDSTDLIAAMKKRYPNEAMEISLILGAKVAKGEMPWG